MNQSLTRFQTEFQRLAAIIGVPEHQKPQFGVPVPEAFAVEEGLSVDFDDSTETFTLMRSDPPVLWREFESTDMQDMLEYVFGVLTVRMAVILTVPDTIPDYRELAATPPEDRMRHMEEIVDRQSARNAACQEGLLEQLDVDWARRMAIKNHESARKSRESREHLQQILKNARPAQ